jgi:hypothetical protein
LSRETNVKLDTISGCPQQKPQRVTSGEVDFAFVGMQATDCDHVVARRRLLIVLADGSELIWTPDEIAKPAGRSVARTS